MDFFAQEIHVNRLVVLPNECTGHGKETIMFYDEYD